MPVGAVVNEKVSGSPSGSLSLAKTLPVVTGVSSLVVTLSSLAMGTSSTGSTVTVTVAVSSPPLPSLERPVLHRLSHSIRMLMAGGLLTPTTGTTWPRSRS